MSSFDFSTTDQLTKSAESLLETVLKDNTEPDGVDPKVFWWIKALLFKRGPMASDIEKGLDPEAVIKQSRKHQNACCAGAAAAAITAARQLGAATGEKLAYASSYDKSPGDSFVGYAGILF